MIYTKKKLYGFAIIIGIALIIGLSKGSSYSYAFSEKDGNEKITTITTATRTN